MKVRLFAALLLLGAPLESGGTRHVQAEVRGVRLRHARHGVQRQSDPSRTGSTWCGPPSCPRSRTSSPPTATRTSASARPGFGVTLDRANRPGRSQDDLRVRALRHGRGRRADHVPAPPCLRRAGQVGRGPDLEPVHGHRRVPQLGRVLGSDRDGVLPQRPGALDADPGRHPADDRARAAGRQRRPGRCARTASSSRTSGRASRSRTSPPSTATRPNWGYIELAGIAAVHRVGGPGHRRVRPERRRARLGRSPQLQPEDRRAERRPCLGGRTARASRTT